MARLLLSLFLFIVASTSAWSGQWSVLRTSGDVTMSADGRTWSRVSNGAELPSVSWVRTGRASRVILMRGKERITYGPNTLAAVSTSRPTGQKTRVTQRRGILFVDVEKRRRRHTSVVTPHLAAVVKGTAFEVRVGRSSSSVRVEEGVVEVSNGRDSVDVPAGRMVVSADTNMEMAVSDTDTDQFQDEAKKDGKKEKGNNGLGGGSGGGRGSGGGSGNGSGGGKKMIPYRPDA